MSKDALATYYFIASLRRGLAAGITVPASQHRSVLDIDMAVGVEPPLSDADQGVALLHGIGGRFGGSGDG